MSEILQLAIETTAGLGVATAGLGAAAGLARAAWRAGGQFGAELDHRNTALHAQIEMERARADAEAAKAAALAALQPRSWSYAPHTTATSATPAPAPQQVGQAVQESGMDAFVVPTFATLLQSGQVGRGAPLLFGFDDNGKEITGSWLDLYSTACGGLSGSGKSWTAASLLLQSALWGARIAMIDPHAGDEQSLATRLEALEGTSCYLCEPASTPRDTLATIKLISDELDRRMSDKAAQKRTPWIVAIDEFSSLMRGELEAPLARLVERLGQEGRKFGVYALALGQNWTVSRAGGSELRDSLASAFVHRLRPAQARYLTGLTAAELPKDLLDLPPGTAYLLSSRGNLQRVSIPRMAGDDVERVAGLLTDDAVTMERIHRQQSASETPADRQHTPSGDTAPASATTWSAEEARILSLFLSGNDAARIVTELTGLNSKKGKPYQDELRRVQDVLRRALASAAVEVTQ